VQNLPMYGRQARSGEVDLAQRVAELEDEYRRLPHLLGLNRGTRRSRRGVGTDPVLRVGATSRTSGDVAVFAGGEDPPVPSIVPRSG
jgi:hypothetical protein